MRSWVQSKRVIVVPNDRLHHERQRTQVALVSYCVDKLNQHISQVSDYSATNRKTFRTISWKITEKRDVITCLNGSSVSSVEGVIKHERRIWYRRSLRKNTISWLQNFTLHLTKKKKTSVFRPPQQIKCFLIIQNDQQEQSVYRTYLHGLLENIALGITSRSSSVKQFGKPHLGKTVEGPVRYNEFLLVMSLPHGPYLNLDSDGDGSTCIIRTWNE